MLVETQRQNLTLINTLVSQDAFTFATLQVNSQPEMQPSTFVPMDDLAEAQRYEQMAGNTEGLGEVIHDDYTADAADLFTGRAGAAES